MSRLAVILGVLAFSLGVQASWYWPFGSEDDDGSKPLRISELMEPASSLIDEASDLAADGKIDESVEKYRKALDELDRIERENPERAKGTEFATLRNKRAYVNAAIDSMLLSQIKQNARAVAVSDTTELEKKLAEERGEKPKAEFAGEENPGPEFADVQRNVGNSAVRLPAATAAKPPAKPATRREQAMDAIERGDYAAAERVIGEMLAAKPDSAAALNLKAAVEMRQGRLAAAEATLARAISSNRRSHSAYYNMALLLLQKEPGDRVGARRYYEAGREMGGPENAELEVLTR